MEAKVQRWVQRQGWDRAVVHYQTYWREQLRPAHERVVAAAALRPGDRVIDIACGTGMVTLPAAAAVAPEGRVLATDLSSRMVDETAEQARAAGMTNVDVCRCDAERLETSGVFDVALCSLGLMYVPSPAAAMSEMHRVLRPGGRAVVAVWGERRNCGWADLFPIVDARVSSDVCPLFFALGAPGALVDTFARAALGAAFLGGPVALAYSRFDEPTRSSAHDDYLSSIAPFRGGDGYRVAGEFVIASGRRP